MTQSLGLPDVRLCLTPLVMGAAVVILYGLTVISKWRFKHFCVTVIIIIIIYTIVHSAHAVSLVTLLNIYTTEQHNT